MSHTGLLLTLGRITEATPQSQIAVFAHTGGEFDTVFAATIRTQQLIRGGAHNYIGSYDKTMNMLEIGNKFRSMLVRERS